MKQIFDLSKLTYWELYNLYNQVGWEMLKRTWWIGLIIIGIAATVVLWNGRNNL